MKLNRIVRALGLAGALLASAHAGAQDRVADWPSHTVRMIVPFAPGSTPDILARSVGERLTTTLKQSFIVENRPGAGGNIGTNAVAKSAGDGYTIGISITGPLVNNSVLYPRLPYDPFKELAPVTLAAIQPNVLVVSSALGVDNARQLFDLLRRNPGKYNYASVGAGTVAHLSMELIKNKTGTYIVHIPYNSSPAAVTSMLSGDTQMASLAPAALLPQIRAGKLKAIAVTTAERFPSLPDLPTFREIGIPEVVATAWIGVVVPASTPAPLVQRINEAFVAALKDPQVVERLRGQGMETVGNTPQQFAKFMQEELARWAPVIRRSGVTLD